MSLAEVVIVAVSASSGFKENTWYSFWEPHIFHWGPRWQLLLQTLNNRFFIFWKTTEASALATQRSHNDLTIFAVQVETNTSGGEAANAPCSVQRWNTRWTDPGRPSWSPGRRSSPSRHRRASRLGRSSSRSWSALGHKRPGWPAEWESVCRLFCFSE